MFGVDLNSIPALLALVIGPTGVISAAITWLLQRSQVRLARKQEDLASAQIEQLQLQIEKLKAELRAKGRVIVEPTSQEVRELAPPRGLEAMKHAAAGKQVSPSARRSGRPLSDFKAFLLSLLFFGGLSAFVYLVQSALLRSVEEFQEPLKFVAAAVGIIVLFLAGLALFARIWRD